jgi:hypothetical protein
MKYDDEEYNKLFKEYYEEQYNSMEKKPEGFIAKMGFYSVARSQFKKKMISEGKISEDVCPQNYGYARTY